VPTQPVGEDYTVFLQLLDGTNHLVGQRDAAAANSHLPRGRLTLPCQISMVSLVEPGTPPGVYRLVAGLYNSRTGERLISRSGKWHRFC
jgi:hypothetical protein